MSRLLICSEPDLPSVNMRKALLSRGGWEDAGSEGTCTFLAKGDTYMLSTPDLHIYADGLDGVAEAHGISVGETVFMSRHSSSTGEPAMTVHPIGNYHENRFGGRERALVKSAPALMTDALRRIHASNVMPEFMVCFEVTHHGPWTETPTFFIEIGSDERNWGNLQAAEVLAQSLCEMEAADYPTVVGIGGGHYAPRFTEVALGWKVNFGHMIPNYQLDGQDDGDIIRMVGEACTASSTDSVYIHRNAMKKAEERRIRELLNSSGYDVVTSADFEPLNGN